MAAALAAVVAASATIGVLLGMLIAFLLGTSMSSAAPVGALSGGFAIFVFLLNAKENGGKGLFSLHKKIAQMDDYHLKLPLVPRAGLEPARAIAHQILSLARLPIPPPRHKRTLQATV